MRTADEILRRIVDASTDDLSAALEDARTYLARQKTTRTILIVTRDNAGFFTSSIVGGGVDYMSAPTLRLFDAVRDTEQRLITAAVRLALTMIGEA